MAKQKGIFPLEGAMGETNFTKRDGVFRAGFKGGGIKDLKTNPKYKRLRENNAEFSTAGNAADFIRKTVLTMLADISDGRMFSRLQQHARFVINEDTVNVRGKRTMTDGNPAKLHGFEFNKKSSLGNSLPVVLVAEIDRSVGKFAVGIPAFIPATTVRPPQGATHYQIMAGAAVLNFATEEAEFTENTVPYTPVDQVAGAPAASLICMVTPPAGTETIIGLVGIRFAQELNGVYYPLAAAGSNPLTIIAVDA